MVASSGWSNADRIPVAIVGDQTLVSLLDGSDELEALAVAAAPHAAKRLLHDADMRVLVVSLALAASSRAADRAVAFIRLAKRRRPDVGIVALGPALDAALLRAAVDAGADACCLATAPPARLAQAIKAVASGAMWLDPGIAGILLHPHPHVNGVHLSLRERAVLALIADGLSNAEIAAKLGCATATVHTHVIRLFRKLGVRDRVRAAVCALRDGLV